MAQSIGYTAHARGLPASRASAAPTPPTSVQVSSKLACNKHISSSEFSRSKLAAAFIVAMMMLAPPSLVRAQTSSAPTSSATTTGLPEGIEDAAVAIMSNVASHLSKSNYACSGDVFASVGDACISELTDVTSNVFDLMPSGNVTSADMLPIIMTMAMTLDVDASLDTICNTCGKQQLLSIARNLEQQVFQDIFADPTCDGLLPDLGIATAGPFFPVYGDMVDLLLESLCSKPDDTSAGSYCLSPEILPTAVFNTGIPQIFMSNPSMLGGLASGGEQADAMTLMSDVMNQLNMTQICQSVSGSGCCAGNMFEALRQFLMMFCMSGESEMLGMAPILCMSVPNGFFPSQCSIFPDFANRYTLPSATDCPAANPLNNIMSFLNGPMKPVNDSIYSGCMLTSGTCPKNQCELLFCPSTQSSSTVASVTPNISAIEESRLRAEELNLDITEATKSEGVDDGADDGKSSSSALYSRILHQLTPFITIALLSFSYML